MSIRKKIAKFIYKEEVSGDKNSIRPKDTAISTEKRRIKAKGNRKNVVKAGDKEIEKTKAKKKAVKIQTQISFSIADNTLYCHIKADEIEMDKIIWVLAYSNSYPLGEIAREMRYLGEGYPKKFGSALPFHLEVIEILNDVDKIKELIHNEVVKHLSQLKEKRVLELMDKVIQEKMNGSTINITHNITEQEIEEGAPWTLEEKVQHLYRH